MAFEAMLLIKWKFRGSISGWVTTIQYIGFFHPRAVEYAITLWRKLRMPKFADKLFSRWSREVRVYSNVHGFPHTCVVA